MLKNELNVQFDIIGGIDHSIQLLHSDELHLVDLYGVRRSSMVKNMLNYDIMLFPSLCEGMAELFLHMMYYYGSSCIITMSRVSLIYWMIKTQLFMLIKITLSRFISA